MHLDHLTQRHARLQRDLANAYSASTWNACEIDRLADALASTEREIAQLRAGAGSGAPGANAAGAEHRTGPDPR